MADLIERTKVAEYLRNLFKGYISDGYMQVDTVDASALVQAVVRDTPAAAEVIKHSRWVRDDDGNLICRRCGSIHGGGFSYCSYCGALMDEEVSDNGY